MSSVSSTPERTSWTQLRSLPPTFGAQVLLQQYVTVGKAQRCVCGSGACCCRRGFSFDCCVSCSEMYFYDVLNISNLCSSPLILFGAAAVMSFRKFSRWRQSRLSTPDTPASRISRAERRRCLQAHLEDPSLLPCITCSGNTTCTHVFGDHGRACRQCAHVIAGHVAPAMAEEENRVGAEAPLPQ